MLRLAIRNILSRKLRFALTAIAIILGTAMMSGTYVLTDQITGAFDEIFAKANEGIDVIIARQQKFDSAQGAVAAPIDSTVVDTVRKVAGVKVAEGQLQGTASLVVNGKSVGSIGGAPSLLVTVAKDNRFNSSIPAAAGRAPRVPGEISIDEAYAKRAKLTVGAKVQVATPTGLHDATLVGIFKFGNSGSLGGTTLTAATIEDAQAWLDMKGKVSTIAVAGDVGITPAVLKERITRLLTPDKYRVETGEESADRAAKTVNDGIGFLSTILSVFALIAILVGSFVIFNVFSITIAQRIREIAMLRTIGASRAQLRRSVIIEALILGVIASLVGIAFGVFIAMGLKKAFDAAGIGLPTASLRVLPRTVIVPLLVGTIATFLAAIIPATRATRIAPVAALREGAVLPKSRIAPYVPYFGVLATIIGIASVVAGFMSDGSLGSRLKTIGVGAALIVIGIGLAMRLMIRPIARAVGAPLAKVFGNSAAIARQNATRDTTRTASTATALMIGVGLVVFIAVFVYGFKVSIFDALDRTLKSDGVSMSENFTPMPTGVVEAARTVPSVASALGIGTVETQVGGQSASVSAIDPIAARDLVRFDWKKGGSDAILSQLGANDSVVEESFAQDHKLAIGSSFTVNAIDGQQAAFTVRGIYRDPQLFVGYTITPAGLARLTETPTVSIMLTKLKPGVDLQVGTAQLRNALKTTYPTVKVRTKQEHKDFINTTMSTFLNVFYALLALSVLISLIGVVITLLLAIYERTREIGMMRAIGTTRGQVRAMILHEGVITCLIGGIVGLFVGLLLGWLITKGLESEGLAFSVPYGTLVVVLILTIVAGLVSALLPARRAAKLQPLDALHYE